MTEDEKIVSDIAQTICSFTIEHRLILKPCIECIRQVETNINLFPGLTPNLIKEHAKIIFGIHNPVPSELMYSYNSLLKIIPIYESALKAGKTDGPI